MSHELLVWYEGSGTGTRRFTHADERGSVIAVSDTAGNVVGINRYDEYGRPQSGNVGRFQYTGQMWLPEVGLYHYKTRNYAPHHGRFMQTDPIGYWDSLNLYAYVGNDPINSVDPLGLFEDKWAPSWRWRPPPADYLPHIFVTCDSACQFRILMRDMQAGRDIQRQLAGNPVGRGPIERGAAGIGRRTRQLGQCIPLSAGPVFISGGSFSLTAILGGSIYVGKFEIPSIGASGWFTAGSANLGWEGFAGGFFGRFETVGGFLGRYAGISGSIRAPIGGSLSFSERGNLTGGVATLGVGGGGSLSYGGTRIKSSNIPLCRAR